jgi:exodeoxyribonuclease VII large subunit
VPKYSELMADIADRSLRLRISCRRMLEASRTHLKAAARGLPRAEDLTALPRQCFDAVDQRLPRALLANTRSHGVRHARIAGRLSAGLLMNLVERRDRRLNDLYARARVALTRSASERRMRFERIGGRLRVEAVANRLDGKRSALQAQAKLLASYSYQGVLARGFAIVRYEHGTMIRRSHDLKPGDALEIQFADGKTAAEVKGEVAIRHPQDSAPSLRTPRKKKGPPPQGSLL